ncbi:MAG: outer membrane lipoprotein carrier protein LolA, partial [Ignavibacterium sp.]
LAALIIGPALSQTDSDKLLKALQKKFDSIEDASVDFVQSHNGKKILSGILHYKYENMLRIDTKKLLIISDGSTSWNFNKRENKVIISNYKENSSGLLSINELVYVFPEGCDISSTMEDDQRILIMIPNSYTVSFDKIEIWLDDDDLLSKVRVNDASVGTTEVSFSNYRLNQELSLSEFSFTPPEGSKIIDLR